MMTPVLRHGFTIDLENSFEECLASMSLFVYYEEDKGDPVDEELWNLYYELLISVGGNSGSITGGPAFDQLKKFILV